MFPFQQASISGKKQTQTYLVRNFKVALMNDLTRFPRPCSLLNIYADLCLMAFGLVLYP